MTVPVQTPYNNYVGNAATIAFSYNFLVLLASDLIVKVSGVTLVNGVDYTVSGIGLATGGTVTMTSAPAASAPIAIYRSTSITRSVDYQSNGDFLSPTVNGDFDRLWLVLQELFIGPSGFGRMLKAPVGETIGDLPAASARLGKLLGFDAVTGAPLVIAPNSQDASSVALALGALQTSLANTVIWSSNYATFALALAAAAGKTLIVNSAVVVASNTTLPSTIAVEVVTPGLITVNAGQTLTINCSFIAGAQTVFAGAGTVVFGNGSRSQSPRIWFGTVGAVYDTQRTLLQTDGDTTGPVHAYEDNNTLNFTHTLAANFNAYASYDAQVQITGVGGYDHHVSFQARPTYSGSGSIWNRWDGFNFLGTHSGSGTVAAMRGVHIQNPLGAGTITELYGVFIQKLDRGASSYGFYSATALNAVSVGAGEAASWLLRGNGQTGGFGLSIQSRTDSSAHILQTANSSLLFGANNTYYGAITAAGLWKMSTVGTTDILSANQRLEVSGVGGATFKATGGAAVACVLNWNNDAAGNALFEGFYTEVAASQRGSIDYNRAGGLVRYNTTSDATLKNILGDAPQAKSVEILESTRLREYSWKDDPSAKPQIGVIAQELYETFKGAVSVGGEYEETVDDETTTKYRPWGVDKTAFTFHLVAGFQHQQARIAALERQVAQLVALMGQRAP